MRDNVDNVLLVPPPQLESLGDDPPTATATTAAVAV
jgi:hypothetical protein